MKNKIILGTLSLLLCITMAGCSSSTSTMTKTNLSSQLDKTNNSIATVRSVNASDVEIDNEKLDSIDNEQRCEQFKNNIMRAQATLETENFYKNEIQRKTAIIKKHLQKEDLKLKKGELNALKDLTANLSNYNDNVARSSNEFNATYRNYNTMKKSASRNIERVNAKLNKITCNSNTRCSYYINILNTLQDMEDILGIEDYDYYNMKNELENDLNSSLENDERTEMETDKTNENTQSDKKKWKLKKNIDTYRAEDSLEEQPVDTTIRNTDTYGPFRRNIDTYRPYGYGRYGLANGNYFYGNGYYGMNGFNQGINPYNLYNANNYNRLLEPVNIEMDEDEEKLINEERLKEGVENSLRYDKKDKLNNTINPNEIDMPQTPKNNHEDEKCEGCQNKEIEKDKKEVINLMNDINKKMDDTKENIENGKKEIENTIDDSNSADGKNETTNETKIKSVSVLKVEEIEDNEERVKAQ